METMAVGGMEVMAEEDIARKRNILYNLQESDKNVKAIQRENETTVEKAHLM